MSDEPIFSVLGNKGNNNSCQQNEQYTQGYYYVWDTNWLNANNDNFSQSCGDYSVLNTADANAYTGCENDTLFVYVMRKCQYSSNDEYDGGRLIVNWKAPIVFNGNVPVSASNWTIVSQATIDYNGNPLPPLNCNACHATEALAPITFGQ